MTVVTYSIVGESSSALLVPDGSPSYPELLAERDRLLKENARLVEELSKETVRANNNWDVVESVAIGEKPECLTCGQLRPCMCDK